MKEPRKQIIQKRIDLLKSLREENIPRKARAFVELWINELKLNPVFDEDDTKESVGL